MTTWWNGDNDDDFKVEFEQSDHQDIEINLFGVWIRSALRKVCVGGIANWQRTEMWKLRAAHVGC